MLPARTVRECSVWVSGIHHYMLRCSQLSGETDLVIGRSLVIHHYIPKLPDL